MPLKLIGHVELISGRRKAAEWEFSLALSREINATPAAINGSYSRVASSSTTGIFKEHQHKENSSWGTDKISARTGIYRDDKEFVMM